jgi:hypothetical protein
MDIASTALAPRAALRAAAELPLPPEHVTGSLVRFRKPPRSEHPELGTGLGDRTQFGRSGRWVRRSQVSPASWSSRRCHEVIPCELSAVHGLSHTAALSHCGVRVRRLTPPPSARIT